MCGSASFIEGVAEGTEHIRIMPKDPKAGPICARRRRDGRVNHPALTGLNRASQPLNRSSPAKIGSVFLSHLQRPMGANESAVRDDEATRDAPEAGTFGSTVGAIRPARRVGSVGTRTTRAERGVRHQQTADHPDALHPEPRGQISLRTISVNGNQPSAQSSPSARVCVGQCGWFGTSEYNCTFELTSTRPASLVIR